MRLVIDTNRLALQPGESVAPLRTFLSASRANQAVLTDYAGMEAYKGGSIEGLMRSMSILVDFPDQVIVWTRTRTISGLRGRTAGLQRRLIDENDTRNFHRYLAKLRLVEQGHAGHRREIEEWVKESREHIDETLLGGVDQVREAINDIAKSHSKAERTAIRNGVGYTPEFIDRTTKSILQIVVNLFHHHPDVKKLPPLQEIPNTLIFRYGLCAYLWALDWAANGGAGDAKADKLRNDVVDLSFASYATFFDGLLSKDEKVRRIHQQARIWLIHKFDCDLPSRYGYIPIT